MHTEDNAPVSAPQIMSILSAGEHEILIRSTI